MITSNYKKHTSKNPVQQFLLSNFENSLVSIVASLGIKNILDVGCGEGFTLKKLHELKIGDKLSGIDYSEDAIGLGKKAYPYLDLKRADIYKLPFKDNSFDLIICTEVLEHLEKPQEALKEIERIGSKYFVLSVPNEPLFMAANFLRGKNLSRWGNDIEHINHWSSLSFRKFIRNNSSLIIRDVRHPFPWTMILAEKT